MDKQIMVYTYNRILFSHKNEWSGDTCCHGCMDEPGQHGKWEKPDTKGHTLFNHLYETLRIESP